MDDALRFLRIVHGRKPAGMKILIWTLPGQTSRFFDTPDEAAAYAMKRSKAGDDVYFGLGVIKKPPAKGRGKKQDVTAITCLWADVDIAHGVAHKKKNLPPDLKAAKKLIAAMGVPATVITHSGHGLQAFWVLRDPIPFTSEGDRAKAEGLTQRWVATMKQAAGSENWDIDAVWDLTRVLRVPGTTNHKDPSKPVQARILELAVNDDGEPAHLYDVDEVEPLMVPEELTDSGAGKATDGSTDVVVPRVGALKLNPQANPPADKFMALYENDNKFWKSWERKRTDMQDQSASSYDLSLASIAAFANWTDQEIVDLLIASRRKHGDDLKLRMDYYVRTVARSKVERTAQAALQQIMQASPVDNHGQASPDKREATLKLISQALGIAVKRWIQHGRTKARYSMVLESGRDVPIGTVAAVFAAAKFRERIYEETGIVLKAFKQDQWLKVCAMLASIAEVVENEDASRENQVHEWLRQYLANQPLYRGEEWSKTFTNNEPFLKDRLLHIYVNSFMRFVKLNLCEQVSKEDLWDDLRAIGFGRVTIGARLDSGKTISRSYWAGKLDKALHDEIMPEPGEEPVPPVEDDGIPI